MSRASLTTDTAPILRMSRTIGSWSVRLEALSVGQLTAETRWPPAYASATIKRLIGGAIVRESDEETCYTYSTCMPAAVRRQWRELHFARRSSRQR